MLCTDFGFGKGIGVIGYVRLLYSVRGARIDKICLISILYLIKYQVIVLVDDLPSTDG